jgi:hypothetical protein
MFSQGEDSFSDDIFRANVTSDPHRNEKSSPEGVYLLQRVAIEPIFGALRVANSSLSFFFLYPLKPKTHVCHKGTS